MKIIAIIQARVGSTRLPGKVLLRLQENTTVLENVINRVKKSILINNVIVATSINEEDLAIAKLCKNNKINVFRGSSDDVLDRFFQAIKSKEVDLIVRITADCPMIDPEIIDKTIQINRKFKADYTMTKNFPNGLDVEVFSKSALEKAWKEAVLSSEREHVTPYIKKHPKKFKLKYFTSPVNYFDKRWTLDEPDDFEFIKKVFVPLYQKKPNFRMKDILDYLQQHPELEKINHHIIRDEGYQKSLKKDVVLQKRVV